MEEKTKYNECLSVECMSYPITDLRPSSEHPEVEARQWTHSFSGSQLESALFEYIHWSDDEEIRGQEFSIFRALHECKKSYEGIMGEKLDFFDLQSVWLAGGTAQLRLIQRCFWAETKKEVTLLNDCMTGISKGAALYAKIRDTNEIILKERMFDGIYLQLANQKYKCLIAPRDQLPIEEEYLDVLAFSTMGTNLQINLFYGPSMDAERGKTLSVIQNSLPLARKSVEFNRILEKGHKVSCKVQVNLDRNVKIEFFTFDQGERLTGTVRVNLGGEEFMNEQGFGVKLPVINGMTY